MSVTDWDNPEVVENIKDIHSLYISTGQISKFRTLFEVIKDIILDDINIKFTKDKIEILKENFNGKSMVYLHLDADFFEFYHLTNDMTIGINSINFYKIIKSAKNQDNTIALCIKKNQPTDLIIRIENSEKSHVSEDTLSTLDLIEDEFKMPDEIEYPGSIIMPSSDFQKNIKNIKSKAVRGLERVIDIQHTGHQLVFKYHDKQKITLGKAKILKQGKTIYNQLDLKNPESLERLESEYTKEEDNEDIIQGTYDLDYLSIFGKASSLNSIMLIRIQNDLPLIFEFKVGVLGRFYLLLSPITEEDC